MSAPEQNWAWLGLLKWSLTHVDGTIPSEESPGYRAMSEEDKKFLEEVMKNGIIDEGERMKTILSEMVAYLDLIPKDASSASTTGPTEEREDEIAMLLEELQDIVEQIDFAKSFASMGGLQFLMGATLESKYVPKAFRSSCLAILGTLCQNNPAVQLMMLEQGNIPKLYQVYFSEFPDEKQREDTTDLRARVVQAMSCTIRNHDVAEHIYCRNSEGIRMIESGLGMHVPRETLPSPSATLRRKTLFFLQALLTSDTADRNRIHSQFGPSVQYVAQYFLDSTLESNNEIREMALSMFNRILEQKRSVNDLLDVKSHIVRVGVGRVAELRALDGEEKEFAADELGQWESLITGLARAVSDTVEEPLLLEGRPSNDSGDTLPQ